MLRVDADLVRAAGKQRHLGQACLVEDVGDAKPGQRRLPIVGDPDHTFAALQQGFLQRRIHVEFGLLRVALEQGQVLLRRLIVADQFLQASQRGPAARQDQNAAGIPIQPMSELQRVARARGSQ